MAGLVASGERKDQFIATLGHELRHPLTPITHAVYLLRQGHRDPETVELVETIDTQTQILLRFVNELLDLSRISRGLIEIRPRTSRPAVGRARRRARAAASHRRTTARRIARPAVGVVRPWRSRSIAAGRQQPARECREVHRAGRHDHRHARTARRRSGAGCQGHRHRHRRREPAADFRALHAVTPAAGKSLERARNRPERRAADRGTAWRTCHGDECGCRGGKRVRGRAAGAGGGQRRRAKDRRGS